MSTDRFARARFALALAAAFAAGLAVMALREAARERVASATTRPLPDAAVRLVVDAERLRFEFATPMVGAAAVDAPGATAGVDVTLDPPLPCALRWSSATTLDVLLAEPLPRARTTRVRLGAGLFALDGRVVAPAREFDAATPGPQVVDVKVAAPPPGSAAPLAFALTFDLPVAAAELQRALAVTAADGAPLVARVTGGDGPRHLVALELRPDAPRPAQVEVALAATLRSTVGPLPLTTPWRAKLPLAEPLAFRRSFAADDGLWLHFNHELGELDPAQVAVEPPLPLVAEVRYGALHLRGALPPGRSLTVHLPAGFPGRGAERLAAPLDHALFVPDREPALDFAARGEVLSSAAGAELEVATTNVEQLEVALWSIYPSNVVALAQDVDAGLETLAAAPQRARLALVAARNERTVTRLDLAALFGAPPRGPCVVELAAPAAGLHWPRRRLLQVSDLGLSARVALRDAVVAVRTLAGDEGVEGATVELYTPTRQRLARGTTGADGLATLPLPPPEGDRVPFLLLATRGEEVAWLELERFRVDLAHLEVGGAAPTRSGAIEAFLHPARGVVRPGESIDATALVRERDGRAAAGVPLVARFTDARGRLRRRLELAVPGSGVVPLAFATTSGDPTGAWRLELLRGGLAESDAARERLAEASCFVDCFVPDRLEVDAPPLPALIAGAPIEWAVAARWLAGGGAAGRRVVVRPRCEVGRGERDGFASGLLEPAAPPGDLAAIETVTDAAGRARISFALPPLPEGVAAWRVVLHAEVEDPSGRVVRRQQEGEARRAGPTLGVRRTATGVEVAALPPRASDASAASRAVPREPIAATLELERRRWQWELGGDGRWRSRVAATVESRRSLELQVGSPLAVALPAFDSGDEGWRVVVVRGAGQRGELLLDDAAARPDRLALRGPAQVAAGRAFTVEFDAPFAGHALVTLEGERLHAARSLAVEKGRVAVTLELPSDELGPTVHAVVALTRPQARRDATPPDWLMGALPLAVERSAAFLAVELAAPDVVLPGSDVAITVAAPGATAATVALIDVGILQRTRHPDPDPRGHFLARRRLATRGADSRVALLSGAHFPLEKLVGGDDALLEENRALGTAEVATVALFRGDVALDADGRALLFFPLPDDYEGRLRLAVVAAGPLQSGAAVRDIVVRAPLSLQLAGPRRLATGDRSEVVVTFCNRTGSAATLDWDAQTSGGLALLPAAAGGRLELTVDERREVRLALQAGSAGGGELRVTARGAGQLREVALSLAIAPRARAVVRREALALGPGEHELALRGDWLGDAVELRLVVDRRPQRQLEPLARALIDYPHGCLEQTTSRCHALLAVATLFPQLREGDAAAPERLLAAGIERLLSMQLSSGGFAFWPGGSAPHPFGTLWALDLLARAQAAGQAVPDEVLARGRRYVEREVVDGEERLAACFALEQLSRGGRPWAGRLAALAAAPPDGEGALLLALAAARLGDGEQARALLAKASAWASEGRAADAMSAPFASSLRRAALELRVRLALDPADAAAAPLADRLQQALRDPERLTTHEQAQLLLALCDWYPRFASERSAGAVTLQLGAARHELPDGEPFAARVPLREAVRLHCPDARFAALEWRGLEGEEAASGREGFGWTRRCIDVESGAEVRAGAPLRRGHLYDVVVEGGVGGRESQLLLQDLLPAGVEPEPWRAPDAADPLAARVEHVEARDDRVLLFFAVERADGRFTLRHRVRALFAGRYASGASALESLYAPGRRAALPSVPVEIVP
ncbi:MAG: hypothetical protein JNL90_06285 [Planctomycetes bacterium]|nr:hypothetical protein [Planctomycetota bacterium]